MPSPRIIKVNTLSFESDFDWRWSHYIQNTDPSLRYHTETLDSHPNSQEDDHQSRIDELMESYDPPEKKTTLLDFKTSSLPLYLSQLNSLKCCGSYKEKFVFTAYHANLYDIAPPVYEALDSSVWSSQKPHMFSYREFFRKLSKDKFGRSRQSFKFDSNTGFENLLLETTVTQKLQDNEHLHLIEGADIKAWIPKAYTSGASPLELTYKSLTQAKLTKTSGAIIPILVPVIVKNTVNRVTTEQEAYFYTFMINADLQKIDRYKKARRYYLLYIKRLVSFSGLYYADKQVYDNMVYDNPYMRYLTPQHLAVYHSICNESVKQSLQSDTAQLLSLEELSPVISERVLPEEYISKKAKLDKKIQLLHQTSASSIDEPFLSIRTSVENRLSLLHDQKYKKQRISGLIERLEETKHLLGEIETQIHQHRLTVQSKVQDLHKALSSARSYLKAKLKFIGRQKSLNETFLDLLKTTPLEVPKTEQNLLNDFAIQSIKLHFENTGKRFILDANTNKDELFACLATSTPSIEQLVFLTKTPSKIRIDGKDENARVGGPYKVTLTAQTLSLSLAQSNAYIGIDGRSLIFHPHTSSRSSLTDSTSSCLGEASPLIYAAFKTNRISRIILAANTWLTSANSADTWGKRYVHFPYWSDYEAYLQWRSTNQPLQSAQEVLKPLEEPAEDFSEEQQELPPQQTAEYTRYTPR